MKVRLCLSILLFVALAGFVQAQCSVATPQTGNNAQNGTMFDIVNISAAAITVTAFDQSWGSTGTIGVAIYTKAGTFLGSESNAAAWTIAGSVPSMTIPALFTYQPIPVALSVVIPAGATQGFYITSTTLTAYAEYTTGTNHVGAVIASDSNIQVKGGVGKAYPFGATFGLPTAGRIWNGRVYYSSAGGPNFQTNSAQSSLTFDAATGSACAKATLSKCFGSNMNVTFASSTLVGSGYEIVVAPSPLVAGGSPGSIVTANGQVVNVNFADPNLFFLFGLSFPPFPAPFGGVSPVTVPVGMPFIPVISAQMAILDGSHPDGFRLSQATELHGVGPSATASGPVGDDIAMTISAGQVYTDGVCGSFVAPALPLFGVVQNTYNIITNGRITFPGADTGFTPTVLGAQTGPGSVGCWTDFNTLVAGNISLAMVGTTFVATWNGVGYYGQAGTASTFSLAVDSVSGVIVLNGLLGIGNPTVAQNMLVGVSPGTAATDPGQAAFGLGGAGFAALATDMTYRFAGTGPNIAAGANTITFTPDGLGNYTWTSN